MLPVGQGDCVVMQCPNGHLVMYDCGSIDAQKAFTTEELKFAILKYVKAVTIFISHGDLDHYKYLPNLFPADGLVKIFIDYVIIGGDLEDYTQIQGWMHSVASKGKLYKINDGEECIGDCSDMLDRVPYHQTWTHQRTTLGDMNICRRQDINFDIIAANVRSPKNQKSIVLKATAGGRSMLLSGDIEGKAAEAVAKDVPDQLKSDVYRYLQSSGALQISWGRSSADILHQPNRLERQSFLEQTIQKQPLYDSDFSVGINKGG